MGLDDKMKEQGNYAQIQWYKGEDQVHLLDADVFLSYLQNLRLCFVSLSFLTVNENFSKYHRHSPATCVHVIQGPMFICLFY